MTPPLVSIVIPAFNRSELFGQVVDSLVGQGHGRWEALVVDDGSEAEHRRAIEEQCARDERIRLFAREGEKRGAPVCRNQGFERSAGDYVIFLDADDALGERCLEERVRAMEAYPDLDFGVFPCRLFRERPGDMELLHNRAKDEDDLTRFLMADVPWQTTSPMWRRGALERLGPWDEDLPSWQDWEFHIRALAMGMAYRRFLGGVSYWRVPTAETVGKASFRPEHFEAQGRLCVRVAKDLERRELLTGERRFAAAGRVLEIAGRFTEFGDRRGAFRLWKRPRREGLISGAQWLGGCVVIWLHPIPVLGRGWRVFIRRMWPRGLYPIISKTAFVTPLDHLEKERARYTEVPEEASGGS